MNNLYTVSAFTNIKYNFTINDYINSYNMDLTVVTINSIILSWINAISLNIF